MNPPSRVLVARRCAYCNEPFRITEHGVDAQPAGDQFVCTEFCGQALREEALLIRRSS